jgi:hypothetical protein
VLPSAVLIALPILRYKSPKLVDLYHLPLK